MEVTAIVLCVCALLISCVVTLYMRSSTPLRLLERQAQLEAQGESIQRDQTALRQAWTSFLAEYAEVAEGIESVLERTRTERKRVEIANRRAQAPTNGQVEESLEAFERRLRMTE